MSNQELADRIIEDVLSSPEFHPEKTADLSRFEKLFKFIRNILEIIFEGIGKLIETILRNLNLSGLGNKFVGLGVVAKVIIYILSLLVILLFTFLIVKLVLKMIRNRSFKFKKDDLSDELEEFTKAPDEPMRLALEYKEQGNYRLAFRYFFLALLINFNERELIKIQKFKTNMQYYRELFVSDEELAKESESFFNTFYYVWYGKREINKEELLNWEEKYYLLTEAEGDGANDEKQG